jgi:hypothetical protein
MAVRSGAGSGLFCKRPFTETLWNCKNRLRTDRRARMPPSRRQTAPAGRRIGYARVSTDAQGTDPQLDELRAAGCEMVLEEHASGADRGHPVLARLLQEIRPDDTLVVVRLDRLPRSMTHLLAVIEQLEGQGAHFRSPSPIGARLSVPRITCAANSVSRNPSGVRPALPWAASMPRLPSPSSRRSRSSISAQRLAAISTAWSQKPSPGISILPGPSGVCGRLERISQRFGG